MAMTSETKRRIKIITIVTVIVIVAINLICYFTVLIVGAILGFNSHIASAKEDAFLSQDSTWVDESGAFIMTVSKEDKSIFISENKKSSEIIYCDFDYFWGNQLITYEFIPGELSLSEGNLIKYDYVTYWEWDGEDVFTVKFSYADTYHYGYGRKKVHPSLSFEKDETFEIVFKRQD